MRYKDTKITSVQELLTALARHLRTAAPVWFRGQASISWKLLPSLVRRPKGLEQEQVLVKRFKQNAFLLLEQHPQKEHEWLFVMQHHGVPTRLLDWTESPLVGLFFAVNKHAGSPGALWVLRPLELNPLANIPTANRADIPGFDEDQFLESYLPSALTKEQQSSLKTLAIIAPRNTSRSQAQLTVFTISHRDLTPIEAMGSGNHVWRYIVPAGSKKGIRKELERLRITKLTLFPELDNVGAYAKEIL